MADDPSARLAAELEVRNIIARLAILADQGDLEEYLDQFTEDCLWDFPPAPRRGRADILAGAQERRATGVTGPGSATRHVITNVSVRVDGASSATADSYFVFFQNTTTNPSVFNMGHYHDTFVRESDRWRLAKRTITLG